MGRFIQRQPGATSIISVRKHQKSMKYQESKMLANLQVHQLDWALGASPKYPGFYFCDLNQNNLKLIELVSWIFKTFPMTHNG
jgi:hypothetical protein